jgi:hypothetical protein
MSLVRFYDLICTTLLSICQIRIRIRIRSCEVIFVRSVFVLLFQDKLTLVIFSRRAGV